MLNRAQMHSENTRRVDQARRDQCASASALVKMSDCNRAFAEAVAGPEQHLDLARAALLFACETYPDLSIHDYLAFLDEIAEQARPQLADHHAVAVLNDLLFNQLGFRGNVDDYFDPRNSYLNQVLDRRLGIPITLSAVYLELARRLDLPMVGIGLPGHFIVRYDGDAEPLYLDPFNNGAQMSLQDCQRRVADISDGRLTFDPLFLAPVGSRQILDRMLRNLKGIHVARANLPAAIAVVEKLILLNSPAAEEIRDLGVLHYYAGHKREAVGCLERYLDLAPDAEDKQVTQHNLRVIIEQVARWN